MKVLFVDHIFHRRTRSADFFVAMLQGFFDVTVLYVDPVKAEHSDLTAIGRQFDAVVLWQMDYLAPVVLAQGLPTIVVPMFDGSSQMPDLHWLWARGARFISFSRRLHHHLSRLGMESLLLRYFKPPVKEQARARFDDGLRVLLWQRRPEEGVNLRAIESLFGSQLRSVHIHDAPDDAKLDTRPYLERARAGYELTTSSWFDTRDGFEQLLDSHNVLMAPRRAEGIGMVMLEALSRGMLVAAADAPTHDEYICNWVNGILFNPVAVGHAEVHDPAAIGEMAWRGAIEGYDAWRAAEPRIVDWIRGARRPARRDGLDLTALQLAVSRAHRRGGDAYRRFLRDRAPLIGEMSGLDLAGTLNKAGVYNPERPRLAADGRLLDGPVPEWLAQNRLSAADLIAGRYVTQGLVRAAPQGGAQIDGDGVELAFCVDPRLGTAEMLRLTVAPGGDCAVSLNGRRLAGRRNGERLEFTLPVGLLRIDNRLTLRSAGAASDRRRGSRVTIRQLELAAS